MAAILNIFACFLALGLLVETRRVNLFSEEQLQRLGIDALRSLLRPKLGGYIIAVKDIPAYHLLYRGVRCEPRPDSLRRISYPPAAKVTTCQRVNRAGEPRFYRSVAAPAVFYELDAKQGDFIALSTWELIESLWVHNLGYHPQALERLGTHQDNIVMRKLVTHSIPNESRKTGGSDANSRSPSPPMFRLARSTGTSCLLR